MDHNLVSEDLTVVYVLANKFNKREPLCKMEPTEG